MSESLRDRTASSTEGSIKVEFSTSPAEQESEIPEWRHELSRRLHEIKRKRDEGLDTAAVLPVRTFPFPHPEKKSQPEPPESAGLSPDDAVSPPTVQEPKESEDKNEKVVRLPERTAARPKRILRKPDAALPLFQPARGKSGARPIVPDADLKPIPTVTDPDPAQLQKLLDTIVLRQTDQISTPAQSPAARKSVTRQPGADMMILLSRTLSGFLDMLIVVFVAGGLIVSADFFSGIETIDDVSKVWYGALFLATYLLYATFFLGTANQTIGMMIKDLKIVDEHGGRPGMDQVLRLSVVFLPSLLMAGFGLLWSFFDREHRCLHDRLSHTRVMRL